MTELEYARVVINLIETHHVTAFDDSTRCFYSCFAYLETFDRSDVLLLHGLVMVNNTSFSGPKSIV